MIDPNYITGFVDGEGNFSISISPRNFKDVKWEIRPSFSISQRKRDRGILFKIKDYFGCGIVRPNRKDNTYKYEVRSLQDLKNIIIPHFKKYPLQTTKRIDFEIFSQVIQIMEEGKHLTKDGLKEIIELLQKLPPERRKKYKIENFCVD
jgi:hypothetical protein